MGCLTDGYIGGAPSDNDWVFSNVGGAVGPGVDPYDDAWARLSDGPIPGAKVNIDGSVSEGPTIDLSVIGSIPENVPRDDEAERPYIAWAGVNPMSLTEGLIVWNKEILLLNRNAIVGNSEESNVEFISVVGRLMVVKLSKPVPITSAASAIITIGAGAVGMYTDEPLTTCPAEAGSPDEEPPDGEGEEEEVDDTAVGIPPGGDLSPAPPSCGSCDGGGAGYQEVYEGPDLSDAYIFTDLCNPNAQCGDVEPDEGVAFSVNNAMTVPLRCCYPFVYCEVSPSYPVWQLCWNLFHSTVPLQTLPLDALEDIDDVSEPAASYSGELLNDTWNGDLGVGESLPARCAIGEDPETGGSIYVELTGVAGPPVQLEVTWGGLLPGWKGQLVRVFIGEGPCPGGGGGIEYVAAFEDIEPDRQDVVEAWVNDEIIKPMERSLSVQFFDTYSVDIVTAAFPEAFEELEIFIPGEPEIDPDRKIIQDISTTEYTCPVPIAASHEYWQFGRDEPSTMDAPFIITDISTGPLPIISEIEMATQTVVVNLETEEHTVLVSGDDFTIPVDWDVQYLTLQSFYLYTELSIATGVSNVVESLTTQSVDIVDFDNLGTVTELVGQSYHSDITFIDWNQGTTSVISPIQADTTDVFLITAVGTSPQSVITDIQLADLTFLTSTDDRGFVSDFSTAAIPLITSLSVVDVTNWGPVGPIITSGGGIYNTFITEIATWTNADVLVGDPQGIINDVSLSTVLEYAIAELSTAFLTDLVSASTSSITYLTSTNDRSFVIDFDTTSVTVKNQAGTEVGITVVTDVNLTVLDNTTEAVVITDLSVNDNRLFTEALGAQFVHFASLQVVGGSLFNSNIVGLDPFAPTGATDMSVITRLGSTFPFSNVEQVASIETAIDPITVIEGLTTVGLDNITVATQVQSIGTDVSIQSTFDLSKPSVEDLTVFLDPQAESISPITDFDKSMETYPVDVVADFTTFSHTVINALSTTEFYAYSTIAGPFGLAHSSFPSADNAELELLGATVGFATGSFLTYAEQTAALVLSEETAAFQYVSTISTDVSTVPTSYGGTGPVSLITSFELTKFFPIDGSTTCTVVTPEITTTDIDIVTSFLSGSSTSIRIPSGTQTDIEIFVPVTTEGDLTFITSREAGCDAPFKFLDRGTSIACGTAVTKNWDEGQCESCGGWGGTIEPVENTDCEDFLLLRAKYVKQGEWNVKGTEGTDENGNRVFLEPSCSCFDGGGDIDLGFEAGEPCSDEDPNFLLPFADPGSRYIGPVLPTGGSAQDLPYGPCVVPFQRLAISDCAFCRDIPTDGGFPPQREKWPHTPTTPYYSDPGLASPP